MKKIIIGLAVTTALASFPIFAKEVTCPPASMVKQATFTRAISYDANIDLWEVVSVPFTYDGVVWNIAYGREFPGVKTAQDALATASSTYKKDRIIDEHPEAIDIPGHVFCDYTYPGLEYWIQALSPPGE